ncbi:hypothetical protein Aple_010960 [Acrocarpospora pleiomorpha]|uniref:Uncharacterized protein n=1 Tax=Acrocarpospora pleiomorpha TaxID=90975 RepID=A0A5M3XF40_9ACTN|nr:hypothetical protein [Acrocarpospora pleiomorpha]GES18201.1 hypothetical protein Aple_010960 [Acrocarpospora pleiomorpha]
MSELTREQVIERNQRTLADLHPDWAITPGRPWAGQPWTARKGGAKVTAADAIDMHDRLRERP